MSIFDGWFPIHILVLFMSGLFVGGLLLNYLAKKANSFYGSWIAHIFADIAVVLIGLFMLGIL